MPSQQIEHASSDATHRRGDRDDGVGRRAAVRAGPAGVQRGGCGAKGRRCCWPAGRGASGCGGGRSARSDGGGAHGARNGPEVVTTRPFSTGNCGGGATTWF